MATRTNTTSRKSSTAKRRGTTASVASELVQQLHDALLTPRSSKERYVGVRNISNYVIGRPNLAVDSDFIDPADPTKFIPNPNACQVVPHSLWMQLRRGDLYERGMIMRDDSILGTSYEAAAPDESHELAAGWAKNAVLDPADFIESKSEAGLREALDAMTSEESLKRLLTAFNQRVEKERRRLSSNGDETLEAKALRNVPAVYHLAEELVLDRLSQLGYR